MQHHEDLAALFSRNLTLTQPPPPDPTPDSPIVYSISQHYHHSAHLVRREEPDPGHVIADGQEQHQKLHVQQRPSSMPPPESSPTVEQIIASNGIDPGSLSHAQTHLFKTADNDQKLRLLELWRICPPEPGNNLDTPNIAWGTTTLEQEETLARLRHERQRQEDSAYKQQQSRLMNKAMSLDGTLVPVQTEDGCWVQIADSQLNDGVEPYMASGYDQLVRRSNEASAGSQGTFGCLATAMGIQSHVTEHNRATDPVYRQEMENQYGAFQMRGTCSLVDEMEVL